MVNLVLDLQQYKCNNSSFPYNFTIQYQFEWSFQSYVQFDTKMKSILSSSIWIVCEDRKQDCEEIHTVNSSNSLLKLAVDQVQEKVWSNTACTVKNEMTIVQGPVGAYKDNHGLYMERKAEGLEDWRNCYPAGYVFVDVEINPLK